MEKMILILQHEDSDSVNKSKEMKDVILVMSDQAGRKAKNYHQNC